MFIPRANDGMLSSGSLARFFRGLPPRLVEHLRVLRYKLPGKVRFHDYEDLWRRILAWRPGHGVRTYPGAFVDWDNTARYGRRARIVRGANPDRFRYWLNRLVNSLSDDPPDHRLVFINAWNEWAEGAYLEPDERYGYAYLEAVRDCVTAVPPLTSGTVAPTTPRRTPG